MFEDGWLQKQIDSANSTIDSWSDNKKAIMLLEDNMSIIDTLKADIKILEQKIEQIQNECSHPESAVERKNRSDVGNWCTSDDTYWEECECKLCQKTWIDEK